LKVGLTGGIATGKSHVLSIFRRLGCQVIDADEVARAVVEPCQPAYHDIKREFGPEVLEETGAIDRARLGNMIFQDPQKRLRLNAIVHPRVMEEIGRRVAAYERSDPGGIVVVDGALIVEAGVQSFFEKLIVVYCDPEEQVRRLRGRDGLSRDEALRRIQSQMSTQEKRDYADFEVETSGRVAQTQRQVEWIYGTLRAQAEASPKLACGGDAEVVPSA